MTYTSVLPSYWPVKASHFPSGENRANISFPSWLVSLRATPPPADTGYTEEEEAEVQKRLEDLGYVE